MIITETVNGVTNYISLNAEGKLVTAALNPMELPTFMTKEQAFEVIKSLRLAAQGTENKYRVKAVSQALRDYITHIIYNELPESPMVSEDVIKAFTESMKPKKAEAEAAKPEQPAETETTEQPAEEAAPEATEPAAEEPEAETKKAAKKSKKQNK